MAYIRVDVAAIDELRKRSKYHTELAKRMFGTLDYGYYEGKADAFRAAVRIVDGN